MKQKKILIGIPLKTHISLAMDEIRGLTMLGYECSTVPYGRDDIEVSLLNKLIFSITRALKIVVKLYKTNPSFLYLNSRFEPVGGTRDFITIFIMKLFYYKKVKVIIKSHGSDHSILLKDSFLYKKIIVPYLRKKVDAWLFLSNEEKQLVENVDAQFAKKIFVSPNIVDPSRCERSARFLEKYNIPADKIKVLYVGRMERVKGIFDFLESIHLIERKEECAFIFVGNGPDFDNLKQQSVHLGIDNLVYFPGYLPDAECDHFYANSDFLVYPTYFTEGFPMAIFKSVANGLPVITTQIRAAKDYLQEPENTLWVKEKSPSSVADAITKLLNDTALRQQMGRNNIELGKEFTEIKVAALMSEIFLSLL